jgi:hypothetical protein
MLLFLELLLYNVNYECSFEHFEQLITTGVIKTRMWPGVNELIVTSFKSKNVRMNIANIFDKRDEK